MADGYRCIKCGNMLDSPQHEFACGGSEGAEDEEESAFTQLAIPGLGCVPFTGGGLGGGWICEINEEDLWEYNTDDNI